MELHAAHPVDFGRSLHLIFLVHLLVAKVYVLILRVGVELSEALPPLTLPLQCQLLVGALLHQQITSHFGVLRPARGCEGVHVIIALESASSPLGCCWQGNVRVGF